MSEDVFFSLRMRRLFFIYVSVFIISVCVGACNPLIPIYAELLGASYLDLGVIGAAYALPYVLLPVFFGFMSDRFNRIYFYLSGIILTALTTILLILASNVAHIVAIRAAGGLAAALMWPPVEALLVDLSNLDERSKVMGRYSFCWGLGLLLGPPIGGLIVEKTSFLILFTVSFAVGLAAAFIAFYGLVWKRPRMQVETLKSEVFFNRPKFMNRKLLPVYILVVVYSMVLGVIFSIFPVYVSGFGITSFQIGILFAILGTARIVTFLHFEKISRIGTRRALILGLAIQTLVLFLTGYLVGFGYFVVLLALLGLAVGIFSPLALSTASKLALRGNVGATIGFVEALFGVGMAVGPFSGGLMAESLNPVAPYVFLAILSMLTVAPVLSLQVKERGKN